MKITILDKQQNEEDEIIVKCEFLDEGITRLLNQLKNGNSKMNFYKDNQIRLVEKSEILYFESVDDKVFAYTQNDVLETRLKLYELEDMLRGKTFIRVQKGMLLNLMKIKSIKPALSGRYTALLKNGEQIVISRKYVLDLKSALKGEETR